MQRCRSFFLLLLLLIIKVKPLHVVNIFCDNHLSLVHKLHHFQRLHNLNLFYFFAERKYNRETGSTTNNNIFTNNVLRILKNPLSKNTLELDAFTVYVQRRTNNFFLNVLSSNSLMKYIGVAVIIH